MAFETFDLGKVFAAGEQIKGMRREASTDALRDRYLQSQIAGSQQAQGLQKQEADVANQAREARTHYLAAQAVEMSDDPVKAAKELAPEMIAAFEQQHGPGTFAQLPPDVVKQIAAMGKEKSAATAGISLRPDPNVAAQQGFAREMDATNFGQQKELAGLQHQNRLGEIAATSRVKPGNSFRPLTPQEIAQAGLPPGTSAQVDETTGKVDVLSKRDATATLNQKDATTAKMKLNTVKLARQQLNAIKESFDSGIQGMNAFGPVQGVLPTEKGHAFDRRVDQMRSTLTALTRVPGVGAMSDYETKLDQAKFPSRSEFESVTKQQLSDLDSMLNAVETGYSDLLTGGSAPNTAPSASGTGGWSVQEVK